MVIVVCFVIICILGSLGLGYVLNDIQLKIILCPFYGGFLAVTLLCLACATPKKRRRKSRIILLILGLLFLLLQGLFWGAVTAYGNATGGGVDAAWWHNIMAIAVLVFV